MPELLLSGHKDSIANNISVIPANDGKKVTITDNQGHSIAVSHTLTPSEIYGQPTYEARLTLKPVDTGMGDDEEYQFGLGQFQDGYTNVFGLSRRLTQVNTQTSIPMLISNKGYGILWHNYGLTEFNPANNKVALLKQKGKGKQEVVDVTTTHGGEKEVREQNIFTAEIEVPESGNYSLLLDVGQNMARRHNLIVDTSLVIEMQNRWLPPTASKIVHLTKGKHKISAELTNGDNPTLYYKKVTDETVFHSPVGDGVDYIVFFGSPDEIIASYRKLTGDAPLIPKWALGYIHCRERFHNQNELLETATRFRAERLPIDMIVQDWQYWGKNGWNSMSFDSDNYPDPKQMTDSLHKLGMKLMLSVWSKIDRNSEVGKQMATDGYFIPETEWVDFFNPEAAEAYWKNFSTRLVPLGIDAWWQDATEPENDDLKGRMICNGKYPGEIYRNVYPLFVNKTVYEGLLKDNPGKRPFILTRSGFSGIQRYGTALWSGDVGSDWESLRRQITSGLGLQAAGTPWWTYDAGGFFRPSDQYTNPDYIQCMLRWIQTSVYLPLMRVHGFVSDTEPWNYGTATQAIISDCLNERYRLLPYIYSNAASVSEDGSTLMRPLIFDFPNDKMALEQNYQYMFGKSLLISPVTAPDITEWDTYLPANVAGWYDFRTKRHYDGGKTATTSVDNSFIPVFVRGGSILPYASTSQSTSESNDTPIEIQIYPGANATFTLYEDDGTSLAYLNGEKSKINFNWNDTARTLTIDERTGAYDGMPAEREFIIRLPDGEEKRIAYNGNKTVVALAAR